MSTSTSPVSQRNLQQRQREERRAKINLEEDTMASIRHFETLMAKKPSPQEIQSAQHNKQDPHIREHTRSFQRNSLPSNADRGPSSQFVENNQMNQEWSPRNPSTFENSGNVEEEDPQEEKESYETNKKDAKKHVPSKAPVANQTVAIAAQRFVPNRSSQGNYRDRRKQSKVNGIFSTKRGFSTEPLKKGQVPKEALTGNKQNTLRKANQKNPESEKIRSSRESAITKEQELSRDAEKQDSQTVEKNKKNRMQAFHLTTAAETTLLGMPAGQQQINGVSVHAKGTTGPHSEGKQQTFAELGISIANLLQDLGDSVSRLRTGDSILLQLRPDKLEGTTIELHRQPQGGVLVNISTYSQASHAIIQNNLSTLNQIFVKQLWEFRPVEVKIKFSSSIIGSKKGSPPDKEAVKNELAIKRVLATDDVA